MAKTGVVTLLVIVILLFAGILTVTQLKNSGVFTQYSQTENESKMLMDNYSSGAVKFGTYIPTIMIMLGVLILIGIVVLLIVYIARSTGGGSAGI